MSSQWAQKAYAKVAASKAEAMREKSMIELELRRVYLATLPPLDVDRCGDVPLNSIKLFPNMCSCSHDRHL